MTCKNVGPVYLIIIGRAFRLTWDMQNYFSRKIPFVHWAALFVHFWCGVFLTKCRNPRSVRIIDPLEGMFRAGPGHDLLRNLGWQPDSALWETLRDQPDIGAKMSKSMEVLALFVERGLSWHLEACISPSNSSIAIRNIRKCLYRTWGQCLPGFP